MLRMNVKWLVAASFATAPIASLAQGTGSWASGSAGVFLLMLLAVPVFFFWGLYAFGRLTGSPRFLMFPVAAGLIGGALFSDGRLGALGIGFAVVFFPASVVTFLVFRDTVNAERAARWREQCPAVIEKALKSYSEGKTEPEWCPSCERQLKLTPIDDGAADGVGRRVRLKCKCGACNGDFDVPDPNAKKNV